LPRAIRAGHARQTTVDALGRLAQVVEDPTLLNYHTVYTFGANDTLQKVVQGSQTRIFQYDSLKRLTSAMNPESGSVSDTYDYVGNVLNKTDNRGIVTSYGYDALNRVTLGNVLASNQVTAGRTYAFAYAYNLAGALSSETYPSGRVVTTGYDGANRPNAVNGKLSGQTKPYAYSIAYWPHGGLYYFGEGNNVAPVWTYNTRLQVNAYYATVSSDANRYLLYGALGYGTTNNAGNLYNASEANGNAVPWSSLSWLYQNYSYDNVNRLTGLADTGYSRTFGYDPYGNMWVTGNSGVALAGNTPTSNVFNAANQLPGNSYDAAGNLLRVNGNTASYDAENRLANVSEAPAYGGGSETLLYDGLGQRVRKRLRAGRRRCMCTTPSGSWRRSMRRRRCRRPARRVTWSGISWSQRGW
jgi:YD repeat-containing protein